MIPPVFQTVNVAGVQALMGTPVRIYPWGEAPQQVQRPYAAWTIVTGAPENTLACAPTIYNAVVQISVFATSSSNCIACANAIRDAIEPRADMQRFDMPFKETDTGLYAMTMDFSFWNPR